MSFVRIYLRVLGLLETEVRLAVTLALANIALAVAQFVEPVLFGRIVDALSGALPAGAWPAALTLAPLIVAWISFGLFIIVAGALVAWFSDRLAHRRATWCWRTISSTCCNCRWPITPVRIRAAR